MYTFHISNGHLFSRIGIITAFYEEITKSEASTYADTFHKPEKCRPQTLVYIMLFTFQKVSFFKNGLRTALI